MDEYFIVVDIETDGPAAGHFSMISLGAVVIYRDKEIDSFYRKLSPVPDLKQAEVTMKWWATQPKLWDEIIQDAQPPDAVMTEFNEWVQKYSTTRPPVFVAHPVAFDYPFISWYLWKFTGANPFTSPVGSPRTLDLISYASGKLQKPLSESSRKTLGADFMKDAPPHNHRAIDDARGYGVLLINLLGA